MAGTADGTCVPLSATPVEIAVITPSTMANCAPLVMVEFEGAVLDDARFVSAVLEIFPVEGGTTELITPFDCTRPDSPEVESVEFDEATFSCTKSDEAVPKDVKPEDDEADDSAA
ncbi:hypothetical protein OEA41_003622 [Lepraria neglecta]|uniref:Uncharacterized protein n=1 Tax=Lepraria neglecta TaxID=209136 RepID=A0AAE0DLM2_9LECA|nr:hypothetical protein OEA41_003622 [Lepraria neglecta]